MEKNYIFIKDNCVEPLVLFSMLKMF